MLSNIFQKASSLSESFQAVQDRLPESIQSLQNAKAGASKVQDDLLAKIGTKRQIKTPQGVREVVELCYLGGSSNVIKVKCLASEKEFVLKRMSLGNPEKDNEKAAPAERASAMVSLEALQTLADKADALPALGAHVNIAKCISSQVDNTSRSHGHVFLMEICDDSIASIVQTKGPMSAEEVLKMLKDVVAGLEFLHGQKEGPVIHGSVETSHVLKGKGGEWKLASFGATTFDGESPTSGKVKSDIWQLGVLIFMSLFGAHPFGGASQNSEAAMSLKQGCALAVPHGRPRSLLEGRLCILMHWLLAPDAALRPTSKQVGVMLGHLEKMVASQLMKTLPPPIRKTVCQTMMGAERQTLVEGLDSIHVDVGRILVREFGENILLNPKLIPAEKLQEVMPRAIMSRIKELHTLYGIPEGSYGNVKVSAPKNSKPQGAEQATTNQNKPEQAQEAGPADLMDGPEVVDQKASVDLMEGPQDLLDMGSKEVKAKEVPQEPQDLLDFDTGNRNEVNVPQQAQAKGSAEKESPAGLDLLDFGEDQAKPAASGYPAVESQQQLTMPGDLLDMGSVQEPALHSSVNSQQCDLPGDLLDMGSAQAPPCNSQQSQGSDLLDFGVAANDSAPIAETKQSVGTSEATLPGDLLFDISAGGTSTAISMPNMAPASSLEANNPFDTLAVSSAPLVVPSAMPISSPNVVLGNPFGAANPFDAPSPSQSNPFEASNEDAFAFAVSSLKGEMRSQQ